MRSRNEVIKLAQSWLGKNEKDGSYKSIIDIYNSYGSKLPRNGLKMQYNWSWCACTWSSLAIKLGYTDIMPIEISCGYLIEQAKAMGCWKENDGYVPKPADAVLYDWDDSGKGDNISWPDHVGMVEQVYPEAGYFVTIEGNYSDSVKRRTISINGKYIRGFITPKYDSDEPVNLGTVGTSKDLKTVAMEVIAGTWGSGDTRRKGLEANGFNYRVVQDMVNQILNKGAVEPKDPVQDQFQPVEKQVTATAKAKSFKLSNAGAYKTLGDPITNCRNDAGTNKKTLCKVPKGTTVSCFGYYTAFSGKDWLYVMFTMDGVQYTGFISSACLQRC